MGGGLRARFVWDRRDYGGSWARLPRPRARDAVWVGDSAGHWSIWRGEGSPSPSRGEGTTTPYPHPSRGRLGAALSRSWGDDQLGGVQRGALGAGEGPRRRLVRVDGD